MAKKPDDGPEHAFPGLSAYNVPMQRGMTLRDWFAAQALIGIVMGIPAPVVNDMADRVKGGAREAKAAYAWADAMLAERQPKG